MEAQFFRKTMGAASLAPFFAIQKKFDSGAQREKRRATQALAEMVRLKRERGAGRVHAIKDQKRKDALAQRERVSQFNWLVSVAFMPSKSRNGKTGKSESIQR